MMGQCKTMWNLWGGRAVERGDPTNNSGFESSSKAVVGTAHSRESLSKPRADSDPGVTMETGAHRDIQGVG